MNNKALRKIADEIRKQIITMAYIAKSAHSGGSLSCADLLAVLYFSILKIDPKKPKDKKRDRFIFSKAHDSKALYAALAERGFFKKDVLLKYEKDNGLPGHPTIDVLPGVEVTAGSLGHGLSIGAGMAYVAKTDKLNYRVFVMLSDGECDEGSVWEAALFAGHHKLSNLIAIVDYNKIQSYGRTDEILSLEPFGKKWESFDWEVKEVDGHNISEIEKSLRKIPFFGNKPSVLIAHTIKGYKGVPRHVDKVSSHYKPPTKEEYKEVMKRLS